MDVNAPKNMFYAKKPCLKFKPCSKQKIVLNVFVYLVYRAQKNVALPDDLYSINMFSSFKHVLSCSLLYQGGSISKSICFWRALNELVSKTMAGIINPLRIVR
jgi:hypothetical protein